jgi:Fic family protein
MQGATALLAGGEILMPPVPYHLGHFPPTSFDWPQLIPLIGPANAALARYDGLLTAIPNSAVLLSPMTTQEAVLSSRIEGTQATMREVLEYEAAGAGDTLDPKKQEDIEEVLNYRKVMGQATNKMKRLPLCTCLIKSVHETLLAGVRGHDRARGKFRTIQNYIAVFGRTIEEARYIPIAPEALEAGMARWESISTNRRTTLLCNWPSSTLSSSPCTRFSTVMAA